MKWIAYSLLATAAMTGTAWGHGSANHNAGKKPARAVEETAFGRAGDAKRVSRTIRIEGRDDMRYTPSEIRVRQGETIRFVVANRGKMLHETVLGTRKELDAHYELMKKFPDMEHDEPHMVHLKPGRTGEMIWQFTKAGEFYFACLMPGHYDAGMMGTIVVTPARRSP
ncbi:MAG TPA: cupredoxin family protein [Burkholderiales bacterium]|nr:cupredoxin family protein [Burkholderiales bacterium]